jgi:hypothetical protein
MSSPPKQPIPTKDDKIIRGKLLSRLGIYDGELVPQRTQPLTAAELRRNRIMKGMGVSVIAVQPPPDGSAIRMPLEGVKPFREPLKVDGEMQTTTIPGGRKTRIAFQGDVEVMPIPTRYEYSDMNCKKMPNGTLSNSPRRDGIGDRSPTMKVSTQKGSGPGWFRFLTLRSLLTTILAF